MRLVLALALMLSGIMVAAPEAGACHPVHDPGTDPYVYFDHGCGDPPALCVRVAGQTECIPLAP